MDRIDKHLQHFPDRRNTTCQPDALASIAAKQRQRSRSLVWLMLGRGGSGRGPSSCSPAQGLSGTGHSRGAARESFAEDISAEPLARAGFQHIWKCHTRENGAVASGLGAPQSRPAPVSKRLTTEESFESDANSCRQPARVWQRSKCASHKSPPMSPGGV